MSIEKNKELVMRFLNEFMIGHNIEVLDELLGPNYTQHNEAPVLDCSLVHFSVNHCKCVFNDTN